MDIQIVDADLIGRPRHKIPNLACMKISGYYKAMGYNVTLATNYSDIGKADKTFVAKVFTDTPFPDIQGDNITIGGTGFFFDKALPLPPAIEHHMPDYHLYDGLEKCNSEYYTKYSIGFLTRGCFRHCKFCVNQNSNRSVAWSPLEEFHDPARPYFCFWDDNFLACRDWLPLLRQVIDTGKPFVFKQGLDERLLDDAKCELLFNARYKGEYLFSFDNIEDVPIIEGKLKLIRKYNSKSNLKFYVLAAFKSCDARDIADAFERISLLGKYRALPFVMLYRGKDKMPYRESAWYDTYMALARWCNQARLFKKMSFAEFCELNQSYARTDKTCACMRGFQYLKDNAPELVRKYCLEPLWRDDG